MHQLNDQADPLAVMALYPARGIVNGRVRVPGSKSITNRALLMAALAEGKSRISNILISADTLLMLAALQQLGIALTWLSNEELYVEGARGNLQLHEHLCVEVGNAGTVARFLLPLISLALGRGSALVQGCARMAERPMGELPAALRWMGARVDSLSSRGEGLPLRVWAGSGLSGGALSINAGSSSQLVSSLLLSGAYGREDLVLGLEGRVVSASYIALTRQMMADFGVTSSGTSQLLRIAKGQRYQARHYTIAGDASSASYFFALAAITAGTVLVEGLSPRSEQGDLGFLDLLLVMGCRVDWEEEGVRVVGSGKLRGITAEMRTMSDVALTLAVVALFAEGTTKIREVGHLRFKECDRLAAFAREVTKLGAQVRVVDDGLEIEGGKPLHGARLGTYDDHRMAMALSLISVRVGGISIENPACVGKTYPGFFADFFAVSGVRGSLSSGGNLP